MNSDKAFNIMMYVLIAGFGMAALLPDIPFAVSVFGPIAAIAGIYVFNNSSYQQPDIMSIAKAAGFSFLIGIVIAALLYVAIAAGNFS
jgi:hypothetical protein